MLGNIYDTDIKLLYSYDFQAYKTFSVTTDFIILNDWGEFTSSVTGNISEWWYRSANYKGLKSDLCEKNFM